MDSPTFLKLNRDTRRKTQLGFRETEFTYSPDYMGVRVLPITEDLDKVTTIIWTAPEITVAREYTVVLIVNPKLYEFGMISYPTHLSHTGRPVRATITFRGKGQIELDWLIEMRLMA
jgi:hypothetical protein